MSLLWPSLDTPDDVAVIEAVPMAERGLPATTLEALQRTAGEHPGKIALRLLPDGRRWQKAEDVTYGALRARVVREANALASLGVGRTEAVGILSVNTGGLVSALLASQAVGIAAPVNPVLNPDHVAALLGKAGADVLIASGPSLQPQVWELARSLAATLGLRALLALKPTGAGETAPPLEPIEGVQVAYLDEFAADHPSDRLAVPGPQAQDIAAFFHTGGTTGTPKLAVHTHAMEIADAWSVALNRTGVDEDYRIFSALPLFHVNALIVTTLAPLLRGQTTVWAGPLGYRDPDVLKSFWKIVERYRINAMSAVPAVYAALGEIPVDADVSSLWMCVVGAAPLPMAVRTRWLEQTGIPLSEGYGLTEATCASARSLPGYQRGDTVGLRMPYQRVAAVDTDPVTGGWTFLPAGAVGTIVIKGPVVFPGYVAGRDGTDVLVDAGDKLRDGWLDTGDVGSVTEDGHIRLTGRAKDIIIRGGHNIDPAPVEAVLMEHPAVVDAAVVGRPDHHAGEVPVAFVAVRGDVDPAEIRQWAAQRVLEPAAAPKHVTILPALPLTAIGKPFKVELRRLATIDEVSARLAEIGQAVPAQPWCVIEDGQIVVVLPSGDDEEATRSRKALLASYAIAWRLE